MNNKQFEKNEYLEIITLGKFQVKRGDELLSHDTNRSSRVWELFKYLLANRHRGIVPELALEDLWPDKEYTDPRGAMRALIFRLRKSLSSSSNDYIQYYQGTYYWNPDNKCWLDIEEFEKLIQKAGELKESCPFDAEKILFDALQLYNGEFLPESFYSQWSIPIRNRYHSLCLQAGLELIELLNQRDDCTNIINICERLLITHPYEEEINYHYLTALFREGRIQQAQNHYTYINKKFYQDLGIKPSNEIQNIMQLHNKGNITNLSELQNQLVENTENAGAFICSSEVFKEIYKLERRRGERLGIVIFLALITINVDIKSIEPASLDLYMNNLEKYLLFCLRKGDVIARWGNNQCVLMLPGMTIEQGEKVMQRIRAGYNKAHTENITIELQAVLPPDKYTHNI
ncbi:MAG: BTAD domain-containing putative transcriptional regulator [Syntrophomonadaceae bacterium]|jgi:DNA-binding SARP family transcriptional activator